jgi:hypothetical protein
VNAYGVTHGNGAVKHPPQSWRRAIKGLTRAARRAGM